VEPNITTLAGNIIWLAYFKIGLKADVENLEVVSLLYGFAPLIGLFLLQIVTAFSFKNPMLGV